MVKLRLKRMGKKGAPFYRIVAADSRSPRDVVSSNKLVHTTQVKLKTKLL